MSDFNFPKSDLEMLCEPLDAFPPYIYKAKFDFKFENIRDKVDTFLNDVAIIKEEHGLGDPENDGGISSVHYAHADKYEYENHRFGLPYTWPEFKEYYNFLQYVMGSICSEWGYDPNWQRQIEESWINVHPPGAWTGEHHHQNAMFATTAYLSKPKNSGEFLVRNPLEIYKKGEPTHPDYWNMQRYWAPINVDTNDILIFPGWVTHKTQKNHSEENRYILSSNAVSVKTIDKSSQ